MSSDAPVVVADASGADASGAPVAASSGAAGPEGCPFGNQCNNIMCKKHVGDDAFLRERATTLMSLLMKHTDKWPALCKRDSLFADGKLKSFCTNACCQFTHHEFRGSNAVRHLMRFLNKDTTASADAASKSSKGSS
jgi:hypothetical protein